MKRPEETSFSELLEGIREGKRPAREHLFAMLGEEKRSGAALAGMARRLLARRHAARRLADTQDIVQSALRAAWCHISRFRGRTEREFYGWLRAILRSKVSHIARHEAHAESVFLHHSEARPRDGGSPLSDLLDRELREKVRAAVRQLPEAARLAVRIRLQGAATSEVARRLGLNTTAVRKRHSRAGRKLRELLGESALGW